MKQILITGADGFIGSHLVEACLKEGWAVKAFTYYNSFNSSGWLDESPDKDHEHLTLISGDIRDSARVEEACVDVDIIFHLAALIGIPYSFVSSESYVDTNIKGTFNILQAAKRHQTSRVLITSTSEVYGTAQTVPISETHPKVPQSPYAASKIGADAMAESFYHSFGIPISIVRPFNTYGPRQSPRAIIPTIILQLLAKQEVLRLGNLEPTRDFVFVSDTVRGFLEIAQSKKTIGQHVNIATQEEISIRELAKQLIEKLHPSTIIHQDNKRIRTESSEVDRLLGDNQKIKSLTKWQPMYDLEKGLEETISWFSNPKHRDAYIHDHYHV